MYFFLSILIVIVALLLIGAVTIQESKGGGLAAGFSSSNSIMGVQRTTNAIEKITWWLAGIMAVLCILTTHFAPGSRVATDEGSESVIGDYVDKATVPAPEALPFGDVSAPAEAPVAESTEAPASVPAESAVTTEASTPAENPAE